MRNPESIKISELIANLQEAAEMFGDDAMVVVTSDYGDHCHTPQAILLDGEIKQTSLHESGYSNSGFSIDRDDEEEDEDTEVEKPVFLVLT